MHHSTPGPTMVGALSFISAYGSIPYRPGRNRHIGQGAVAWSPPAVQIRPGGRLEASGVGGVKEKR